MYLQMDPLNNMLGSRPIQMGREMSIEPYPNWQFGFHDDPDRQSDCGSVLTRTRTRSDRLELLLTPGLGASGSTSKHWWGWPECLGGLRVTAWPIYILLMKIPNNLLHDYHTRSPIAATMPLPKTYVSTIDPTIVNTQHSPSCMNMNDVMIK